MTTEPKSGLAVGVWFEDDKCWRYKGSLPALIQFNRKTVEHMSEPYVVSRCPACEWGRLMANGTIKRWMILPP